MILGERRFLLSYGFIFCDIHIYGFPTATRSFPNSFQVPYTPVAVELKSLFLAHLPPWEFGGRFPVMRKMRRTVAIKIIA